MAGSLDVGYVVDTPTLDSPSKIVSAVTLAATISALPLLLPARRKPADHRGANAPA